MGKTRTTRGHVSRTRPQLEGSPRHSRDSRRWVCVPKQGLPLFPKDTDLKHPPKKRLTRNPNGKFRRWLPLSPASSLVGAGLPMAFRSSGHLLHQQKESTLQGDGLAWGGQQWKRPNQKEPKGEEPKGWPPFRVFIGLLCFGPKLRKKYGSA